MHLVIAINFVFAILIAHRHAVRRHVAGHHDAGRRAVLSVPRAGLAGDGSVARGEDARAHVRLKADAAEPCT
jgi:hypothetical protein